MDHRFHVEKVKKLAHFISRNSGSESKRKQHKVKKTYRKLIRRVRWIVEVSREVMERLSGDLESVLWELEHYVPIVERIVYQSEK